jgi:protease IV
MSLSHRLALSLPAALCALGCITVNLPTGEIDPLVEAVVEGEDDADAKILMIEIDGVIRETPETAGFFGTLSEGMVGRLREELELARKDDEIKALLLRINSPGGTVTGSDLLYREIQRFKADRDVPVMAQLMGIATSGGYYVAMAADEVHAQPTTVTGSIGVIFSGVNLTGLMDKIGVEDQTLTSGSFKDAGSMLRPMRPEERAQLQAVLDDLYGRFLEVVREGRAKLTPDQIRELADGRIFSASQALERGLVDEISSVDDTLRKLREAAGVSSARVVTYHRPGEYTNNFYTRPPRQRGLEIDWWPDGLGLRGPAFLYLWAPGATLP